MSKRKVPSLDESKATAEDSYQSAWMAHWKLAKPPPLHKSNFLSLNLETRESDSSGGQEVMSSPSHVPKMDRQIFKVPVKSRANFKAIPRNESNIVYGTAIDMVSRNPSDEESVSLLYPVLGIPRLDNAISTPRNELTSSRLHDEVCIPLAMQSSSKNWIDLNGDCSKRLSASENFIGNKSIMVTSPFHESWLTPSVHSLDNDGNSLKHVSVNTPSLHNRALSLLQNDNPSTGQDRLITFLTEKCHEGFLGHHQAFLSQSSPLEATKRETFGSENPSGQNHSVVDVKTMTTCTFVDSNEELTDDRPNFSRTTHQFFFSEMTDTQLSKSGQIFQESTVFTNREANATFSQFLSLSMNGNYHGNPGMKLQPLWSLTDSEGHENPSKHRSFVVASKKKSSTETNTLHMDAMSKKCLAGEASSSFAEKEPLSWKGNGGMVKVDSSDRKRKFLALTTTSSSIENRKPSPSKIQTFEVEHLSLHEDPGSHSNPGEPSGRHPRMKQPKASEPDHHLESLKMGDESPVEKVKDLFGRISRQMKVTSETERGDTLDEQLMGLGSSHSGQLVKDGLSTLVDNTNAEKRRVAMLLDPWIRRWCHDHDGASAKKKELVVRYETYGKKTYDGSEKKRRPSIAAMALMGKAMNGFHPCEVKRRGSFNMWSSH